MKKLATFTASIYLGLRHGYVGRISSIDEVRQWVQNYCNEAKLGVTFTLTEFIYVDGGEPGVIIGLINYPRFPRSINEIKEKATAIAQGLMELCHQERVSIVFSDETVMLEKQEEVMSDKKEKSYLDYDFAEFLTQMAEATALLKKMNEAATYMRWQYEMNEVMKEFEREVDTAHGWLSSWCG
jgi:hypothetical protein